MLQIAFLKLRLIKFNTLAPRQRKDSYYLFLRVLATLNNYRQVLGPYIYKVLQNAHNSYILIYYPNLIDIYPPASRAIYLLTFRHQLGLITKEEEDQLRAEGYANAIRISSSLSSASYCVRTLTRLVLNVSIANSLRSAKQLLSLLRLSNQIVLGTPASIRCSPS